MRHRRLNISHDGINEPYFPAAGPVGMTVVDEGRVGRNGAKGPTFFFSSSGVDDSNCAAAGRRPQFMLLILAQLWAVCRRVTRRLSLLRKK